jgi:diaminopimelate epimerase
LKFEKWHGNSNDFIVIWIKKEDLTDKLIKNSKFLCSKSGNGIGADGILLIEKRFISEYKLTIINADGSIAKNCGNGIRCVAGSIFKNILSNEISNYNSINLDIQGNKKTFYYLKKDLNNPYISVDMGIPKSNDQIKYFDKAKIFIKNTLKNDFLNWGIVDLSNLHIVFFMNNTSVDILSDMSTKISKTPFWDGINISVVEKKNYNHKIPFNGIAIKHIYDTYTWERGVGPTKACGSAACAIANLAIKNKLDDYDKWIVIKMPGGFLYIKQKDENSHLNLNADAKFVFQGEINV